MKILVPVDRSPMDAAVIPYASKIGKRLRASLAILHVISPMHSLVPGALRQAQAYAQVVAQGLCDDGIAAEAFYAKGDPAPMILEVVEEIKADMIAMATHGRRGMGKLMLGSVAEVIVSTSAVPVLLIRVPIFEEEYGNGVARRRAKTA